MSTAAVVTMPGTAVAAKVPEVCGGRSALTGMRPQSERPIRVGEGTVPADPSAHATPIRPQWATGRT